MTIAFIHPHKAFLPEIEAYTEFFSNYGIKTLAAHPKNLTSIKADVEWHFMGMDNLKNKKSIIKVHEYASASLPPLRKLKDFIKKNLTTKPDFRLFLNYYVASQFNFNDSVPFGFRDMGVHVSNTKPFEDKHDFIYCGSVSKDMHFDKLLNCFTKPALSNKRLLVLSKDYQRYLQRYKSYSNIVFKGPASRQDVANYICCARFAINYKPDIEPHNYQTSTKLLEYAACNIPIITTDFAWMRNFQKDYGGSFFYLEKDLSNFNWENICSFNYASPDLKEWTWEKQIRKSGVLSFLESKFPGLHF